MRTGETGWMLEGRGYFGNMKLFRIRTDLRNGTARSGMASFRSWPCRHHGGCDEILAYKRNPIAGRAAAIAELASGWRAGRSLPGTTFLLEKMCVTPEWRRLIC